MHRVMIDLYSYGKLSRYFYILKHLREITVPLNKGVCEFLLFRN